jgi:hypothetical protein
MHRVRSGKTAARTTVIDANSLTSRGLLTQKKRFRAEKKSFLPSRPKPITGIITDKKIFYFYFSKFLPLNSA